MDQFDREDWLVIAAGGFIILIVVVMALDIGIL